MKILGLLVITILSSAALASPTLEGGWTLSERICSNGSKPIDKFNIQTDSQTLAFANGKVEQTYNMSGLSFQGTTTYKLNGRVLTLDPGVLTCRSFVNCPPPVTYDTTSVVVHYTDTELFMVSGATGNGGSCAGDQALIQIYTKAP